MWTLVCEFTRCRAVLQSSVCDLVSDNTISLSAFSLDVYICQVQILDSCACRAKQRSIQTLNGEVATVELILAKAFDCLPIVTGHIDVGSKHSLSARVEGTCNTSELDESLLAIDDEVRVFLICQVRHKRELCELANSACVDRLNVAVELNGHLAVSLGVQGYDESAVATRRNCNVDRCSLSTEYQALAASYGYDVRSTLQSGQCAIFAINGVRTCDCALKALYDDACNLLAVTLNSQTQYAGEVVELNSSLLSTHSALFALSRLSWLYKLCRISIHWCYARSESTCGVRLYGSEGYRVDGCRSSRLLYNLVLNSYCCRSRVNHAERAVYYIVELESSAS